MKTPDEIKKGLELCDLRQPCDDCPYLLNKTCLQDLSADAIAYIQQLEAELEDMKKVAGTIEGLCYICKHYNAHESECEANDYLCHTCPADCACKECYNDEHYEWHGVKKEE